MSIGTLRTGGAFCLVLCGWCAGDGMCTRMQAHQKSLQRAVALLMRLRREIEFRRTDYKQLLRVLQQEQLVGPAVPSLQELSPFPQMTRREQALFRECMNGLGHQEAAQECQRLLYYQTCFEACQQELLPKLKTTQELSHKLGVALGLAAALIVL